MMNLVENMELFELIMDYEIVIEINQKMIESLEVKLRSFMAYDLYQFL